MMSEVFKKIWSEWQIEEKPLGKGAFGVVYKAVRTDHGVKSYAAIKIISIPADSSEVDSLRSEGLDLNATKTYLQGIVNDFVSEIQLMESLKGIQNIVSVEDYKVVEKKNEIGWNIYIRMELLTPFNTYIRDKELSEKEIIKLGCDICTALEICSKRNIIHRDIKPENIFINDFGYFKLGDFGIARKLENVTGGLSQKGTYNYMAPEVANNNKYDARVDLYSLGIVLYRLLNGNRLPFLETEQQLLNPNERKLAVERRIHGEALPAPCNASPEMANLILRACAFEPNARFVSAEEMKKALESVANGTYQIESLDNLDGTVPVRRSDANDDKTIPVRRTSSENNQKSTKSVDTFGNTPKKKFSKGIVAVVAIAVCIGIGIFMSNIGGSSDNENNSSKNEDNLSETVNYSRADEEEIASIISDAEELAKDKDYKSALAEIETGLVIYPKSEDLLEKSEEYTEKLNAQTKETTLADAEVLAETGDYESAMNLIKKAQATNKDDTDYQKVYNTYYRAYISDVKTEALEVAAGLAEQKDYMGAIEKINEAKKVVGTDTELESKAEEYETGYVTAKVTEADTYLQANDFVSAESTISTALENFPENQTLITKQEAINKSMPKKLLDVCPPYRTEGSYEIWEQVSMSSIPYEKGISIGSTNLSWSTPESGFALFNLDAKYASLSFVIGSRDDKGYGTGQKLSIYLDDNLVWSLDLDPDALPTTYTIDVSGAKQMKIVGSDYAGVFGIANILITEK